MAAVRELPCDRNRVDDGAGVMTRRMGCTAIVLALAALSFVPVAAAVDPSTIYADYILDGKLSCKYSRSDLHAALLDATLNQYGDPYTVARIEKAIRQQLGPGGCARPNRGLSGLWWTSMVVGIPALIVFVIGGWSAKRASSRRSQ